MATDPVRRMRDAYLWVLGEFHRIVSDHDAGTVLDLRKASTPPPVGIAVSIAQSWAAKPCQKRDGLFREIRVWLASAAVKSPDDSEPETYDDGFLDQISLRPANGEPTTEAYRLGFRAASRLPSTASVPEPSCLAALLGMGAVGLAGVVRRRRKRTA